MYVIKIIFTFILYFILLLHGMYGTANKEKKRIIINFTDINNYN